MDTREYNLVNKRHESKYNLKVMPSWRQIFIGIAPWNISFLLGMATGTNTVALYQMEDESFKVSDDIRSWLGAVFPFGALFWFLSISPIIHWFGLKIGFLIVCLAPMIRSIVNYFATSPMQLLCGQAIQSSMQASLTTINMVILTDYISTKDRGVFLTIKSASLYWGVWVANTIGTFFNWHYIAVTSMICSLYGITVWFWPESPYWLASKGRLEECAQSFRWTRSVNEETELELQNLIEHYGYNSHRNKNKITNVKDLYNCLISKDFYMPLFLCLVLSFLYTSTCKFACVMYSLEILQSITSDTKWAHWAMLILDGVNVLGMYCGCFLINKFKRKTSLVTLSAIGITFLFLLSIHKYLVLNNIIVDDVRVPLFFLVIYLFALSVGFILLGPTIIAELFPINHRLLFINIFCIITYIKYGIYMKLVLLIFKLGLNVAFMVHGCLSTFFLILLIIFLPETKGKTKMELNEIFSNKTNKIHHVDDTRRNEDELLNEIK